MAVALPCDMPCESEYDASDPQHVRRYRDMLRFRRSDHLVRAKAEGPDRHEWRALRKPLGVR